MISKKTKAAWLIDSFWIVCLGWCTVLLTALGFMVYEMFSWDGIDRLVLNAYFIVNGEALSQENRMYTIGVLLIKSTVGFSVISLLIFYGIAVPGLKMKDVYVKVSKKAGDLKIQAYQEKRMKESKWQHEALENKINETIKSSEESGSESVLEKKKNWL